MSLMYAMVCTRPDIAYAVGVVSRYMADPRREHWEAVKWLLRYLKGTSSVGLCFSKSSVVLQGSYDANLDRRKSTTGVFTLGGTTVSWTSRLQKGELAKEMIWLKNFLKKLGKEQNSSALFSDSQSAIHLAKNLVFHARTKHIQLRYHHIGGLVEDEAIALKKILAAENLGDMLTKSVTIQKLRLCMASVGLQVT